MLSPTKNAIILNISLFCIFAFLNISRFYSVQLLRITTSYLNEAAKNLLSRNEVYVCGKKNDISFYFNSTIYLKTLQVMYLKLVKCKGLLTTYRYRLLFK